MTVAGLRDGVDYRTYFLLNSGKAISGGPRRYVRLRVGGYRDEIQARCFEFLARVVVSRVVIGANAASCASLAAGAVRRKSAGHARWHGQQDYVEESPR